MNPEEGAERGPRRYTKAGLLGELTRSDFFGLGRGIRLPHAVRELPVPATHPESELLDEVKALAVEGHDQVVVALVDHAIDALAPRPGGGFDPRARSPAGCGG